MEEGKRLTDKDAGKKLNLRVIINLLTKGKNVADGWEEGSDFTKVWSVGKSGVFELNDWVFVSFPGPGVM